VLPGGAFAVEIGVDTPQPRVVPARTSRDYAAKGSPLAVARRKERQAAQRVDAMRKTARAVERENARLRVEASVKEERDLAEHRHGEGDPGRLHAELQRLAREVVDLRAELERRDRELRAYVEAVLSKRGAAREDSRDEGGSVCGTPVETRPMMLDDHEAGDDNSGRDRLAARRDGEIGGEPEADRGNQGTRGAGQDRGLSALANVRNVASDRQQRKAGFSEAGADESNVVGRVVKQTPGQK
jgi:hypothetical protein